MTSSTKDNFYTIAVLFASITILIATVMIPYNLFSYYNAELKTKTVAELVGKGVDPIAARCTIADERDTLCMTFIAKRTAQ